MVDPNACAEVASEVDNCDRHCTWWCGLQLRATRLHFQVPPILERGGGGGEGRGKREKAPYC